MTFTQALRVLWRQRSLILALVVLALVAAGISIALSSHKYTATAGVSVPAQVNPQGSANAGGTTADQTAPDLSIVTSPAVTEIVVKQLGSADPNDISAGFDPATSTISVSATTKDQATAVAEANAYAKAYVTVRAEQNAQLVKSLQLQVDRTNKELATLAGKQQTSSIKIQIDALNQQLTSLNSQIATTQTAPLPSLGQPATSAAPEAGTSRLLILALALAIGLIAGSGIALLRFQFDTRIRTPEQIEELADQPVLAQLPLVRQYRRGTDTLAVIAEPHGQFASAIRELRTSSRVLLSDSRTPVLVITSSVPNEGKTLVTANLAASWALSGKRIALVNGDLRRPTIQQYFTTDETADGLSDVISAGGSADEVADALQDTGVDGLSFLSAGYSHGDPADGLASVAMTRLMLNLRTMADIVIVDSPPVLAAADASIIAGLADGVVVVARADKTTQKELHESIRRLEGARAPVLGIAVNGLRSIAGNAYGEYYRVRTEPPNLQPAEPPGFQPEEPLAIFQPEETAGQDVAEPAPDGAAAPAAEHDAPGVPPASNTSETSRDQRSTERSADRRGGEPSGDQPTAEPARDQRSTEPGSGPAAEPARDQRSTEPSEDRPAAEPARSQRAAGPSQNERAAETPRSQTATDAAPNSDDGWSPTVHRTVPVDGNDRHDAERQPPPRGASAREGLQQPG